MSAAVKLSRKSALALVVLAENSTFIGASGNDALKELLLALNPKPKRFVRIARKRVAAKKKTKREETSELRAAVFARAAGACESRCGTGFGVLDPGELDHFWGRGKVRQAVDNCWALCRACHRRKTDNLPSRMDWLVSFANHCERNDYTAEKVLKELDWAAAKVTP